MPEELHPRKITVQRSKAKVTFDKHNFIFYSTSMLHIKEIFKQNRPTFSFEFFPPKSSEQTKILFHNMKELDLLKPSFVSVTYGASGTTREYTLELIKSLRTSTDLNIVAHLTLIGHTKQELHEIIQEYDQLGISTILALRGDPPLGANPQNSKGDFQYAHELVSFIKKNFPHMGIGVAGFPEGHPQTPNRLKEMDYLKAKVDCGADFICTQLFFDNRDFLDFRERCLLQGINIPIIAGIMPITSRGSLEKMAQLALGARYPAKLLKALARAKDDESIERVGIHWASEQTRDLMDHGVDGVHFYTLNKSKSTQIIYQNLGVKDSLALHFS